MVQQLVLHGILHPMLRSCLLLDLLTVVDVYFHSPFAFEDVLQFFLSGFAVSAKSFCLECRLAAPTALNIGLLAFKGLRHHTAALHSRRMPTGVPNCTRAVGPLPI